MLSDLVRFWSRQRRAEGRAAEPPRRRPPPPAALVPTLAELFDMHGR
ncbi:hypothetical protein [Falsiroseomonas sp.]